METAEVSPEKKDSYKQQIEDIKFREMDDLFKVKIDQQDPEKINMEHIYEDKLPTEAKQLISFAN